MSADAKGRLTWYPSMHELQKKMGLPVGPETVNTQQAIARILRDYGFRRSQLRAPPWTRIWRPPHEKISELPPAGYLVAEPEGGRAG